MTFENGVGSLFPRRWSGKRLPAPSGARVAAPVALLLLLALHPQYAPAAAAQANAREEGAFTLFKFEQPVGQEQYEIQPAGTGSVLTSIFSFTDRRTPVPLNTTLQLDAALAPVHFAIKGKAARTSVIDVEVTVADGAATIRDGAESTRTAAPASAFAMAGYAPPSVQMQMMRFWAAHGRPDALPLLPHGVAHIEPRGRDVVEAGGRSLSLERYSVKGVIWGRESLWCDDTGRLVALVSVDAEFDHFEATSPQLAPALPRLVALAAADGMAALSEAAASESPRPSAVIAVTGGSIIDMSGRPPIANGTVLIKDGRVDAVGVAEQVAVPPDATIVDAAGKFVIPGLWDMHAHFEQVEWGPIYLAAGITTVRDVANELEFIAAVRDAVASGKGLGPRLLLAGIIDGEGPGGLGLARAGTPEEGRRWVNRYLAARFDQIKIYSSIKPDVLRAITAEAHRLGLTVTGHVPEGMNALEAVEAGLDQINHRQYVDAVMRVNPRAAMDLFKKHGTVIDPTLALYELLVRPFNVPISTFEPGAAKVAPELSTPINGMGLPADAAEQQRARTAEGMANVGTLHRAGIPIVAGTDQSVPGHSLHREIELYVTAGFSPLEALQAATIVPARAMKKDGESGTLEKGKRGDVVVLDGNPLNDIRNTRRIYRVITNGRVFDPAPLWRSVGFQP